MNGTAVHMNGHSKMNGHSHAALETLLADHSILGLPTTLAPAEAPLDMPALAQGGVDGLYHGCCRVFMEVGHHPQRTQQRTGPCCPQQSGHCSRAPLRFLRRSVPAKAFRSSDQLPALPSMLLPMCRYGPPRSTSSAW